MMTYQGKKYIDNELDKIFILRFNQTLKNYFKVSVGKDTYNVTKYNNIPLIDTTIIKQKLLPRWKLTCNNASINGVTTKFLRATKTNSPTSQSGATTLSPIGSAFMYIETKSNTSGIDNIFVSWERADIIQITNITFYFNRYSILTNNSIKSMGRCRIQLLLEDNTWSTRYNIPKNGRYSDISTDWTLPSLIFTEENYRFILCYDRIDTPHANMCFSYITITLSVY